MKKTVGWLLMLVCVVLLTSCGGTTVSLAGEWDAVRTDYEGKDEGVVKLDFNVKNQTVNEYVNDIYADTFYYFYDKEAGTLLIDIDPQELYSVELTEDGKTATLKLLAYDKHCITTEHDEKFVEITMVRH
ncbi:hypothetical protein [Vagococcus acidifermentans]|uniref:Lipoprotein n=1 Tax=Vagococcus acidifermentans TaxID=564710 RepID=A0A430ASY6_9ENTE|nr:hypothetical protein [Vagococcus acidifermentans]RSU11171.1 hypothetical protein CBF27_08710 [Vagococcus acidifermentans]